MPSISADGRHAVFISWANNLVQDDTNNTVDVFVHDLVTAETVRVGVASDGTQANAVSWWPSISADGRYVAFYSDAGNLVEGDTNNTGDIFVHDLVTAETVRVSVASDGTQADGIWGSWLPSISADGRYVAFESDANNLVQDDTNEAWDVFVHDFVTGETVRVSVASGGTQAFGGSYSPSISADGRYAAFFSYANNLVEDDTNNRGDVFVHDLVTGETVRVSVASDGTQANGNSIRPSISADGRYVAFESRAGNLVEYDTNGHGYQYDIFIHDLVMAETVRLSVASDCTQANGSSRRPSISADGRYVVFESRADNLVEYDTNNTVDVFVHDLVTAETVRLSVASDGTQANGSSRWPSISADGRYVAFESDADNLVEDDTNNAVDVFVHDLVAGETVRVSVASKR